MPPLPPEALLRRLDFALSRRLEGFTEGEAPSFGERGAIELDRIRPWTPGDDWRLLDPAATARTGQPHVRVPVAERRLTLWLGVDVSASMAFGTQTWEKGDLAVAVGAVLGLIALRRSARVGAVGLTEDPVLAPPRAGRPALLSMLEQLTPAREGAPANLDTSLAHLDAVVRRRSVVAVISDFRDDSDWPRVLARLALQHELLCIEVADPREDDIPNVGVVTFTDPETGRTFSVDTASRRLRDRFSAAARDRRDRVAAGIRSGGGDHVRIRTSDDWLDVLIRHLEHRRRHRWVSATRSHS